MNPPATVVARVKPCLNVVSNVFIEMVSVDVVN